MSEEAQVLRALMEDMRELIRECHEAAQGLRHERQQAQTSLAALKAYSKQFRETVLSDQKGLRDELKDLTEEIVGAHVQGLLRNLEKVSQESTDIVVETVYHKLTGDARLRELSRRLAESDPELIEWAEKVRKENNIPKGD